MNLNVNQISKIKKLLSNQSSGYLPYQLLIEFSKFMVVPIIEVIPLCKNMDGEIKILLLKRSSDDPFWPNKLHTPGTIVRVNDLSLNDAFDRIKNEIGTTTTNPPTFFQNYYRASERSKEAAMCYWIELNEHEKTNGEWYRSNNLPPDIVRNQIALIQKAMELFKTTKTIPSITL